MCNYAGIYRDKIDLLFGATRSLMTHCLVVCAWREMDVVHERVNYHLNRGQLVTSTRKLAEDTGISYQTVRTFLKKKSLVLTQSLNKRATLITIVNVDRYLYSGNEQHTKPTQTDNSPYIGIVFKYYQEKIQKGAQLTPRTQKRIATRLKDFTCDEIKKAIDNFSADKWWMDHNAHRGLYWFLSSPERVQGFIDMGQNREMVTPTAEIDLPPYWKTRLPNA